MREASLCMDRRSLIREDRRRVFLNHRYPDATVGLQDTDHGEVSVSSRHVWGGRQRYGNRWGRWSRRVAHALSLTTRARTAR